jgi:hypothetical protein
MPASLVVVASCSAYEDAVLALERLVAAGIPADAVSISGQRLHPVAQAPVRERAFGGEAVAGSVGGALGGALLAFLFGVIGWVEPLGHVLALALAGVLLGALAGAAAGVLLSFARPPRSPPIVALRAEIYTVAVEPSFAGRATVALVRGHATQVGPRG